ncbi:hypothetical protein EVAR_27109_1 [Eumeta japonica]|uniref:Uncharacterized protein n=1 Tax=Eumeta variegata TaxID=151549 RepID=A0A4C1VKJ4_EUMVA|nr:hypothetical protein EVAR_27109_1 [Eumeta japonica]
MDTAPSFLKEGSKINVKKLVACKVGIRAKVLRDNDFEWSGKHGRGRLAPDAADLVNFERLQSYDTESALGEIANFISTNFRAVSDKPEFTQLRDLIYV